MARGGSPAGQSGRSWHGIPAAGMERVAARDPADGHAPATPPAVALDSFVTVLRAGWRVAAARDHAEEGTERDPIDADQRQRHRRHDPHPFAHNISISWRKRVNSASTARARATITTSRPPSARVNNGLTSSRRRRLTRFLTTALPSFRLTARPTRGRPSSLSLTNRAKYSEAARRPERRVRSKSADRSSRDRRFTGGGGGVTGSAGWRSASGACGPSGGGP